MSKAKAKPAKAPKAAKVAAPKKSEKIEVKAADVAPPTGDEDEDEDMGAGGSSDMDFGAALGDMAAVVSKTGEAGSGSLKNFRHHPDVENFYRFIYENDLRYEALGLIEHVLAEKRLRKQAKATKARLH